MSYIKKSFILIVFALFSFTTHGQNHRYYLRAISSNFNPTLSVQNGKLTYTGKDSALKAIFNNNNIFIFEKAFTHSKKSDLLRVFNVESDVSGLLTLFLQNTSHIFDYGEYLGSSQITLASYPNDYGQTGGANLGINANLSNLDFIDAPLSWDYTTGKSEVKIGISDGGILQNDNEFANRIAVLTNSTTDQVHGVGVTAIAAAKGNNYGTTGVCYDCNIIYTFWNYGDYNRLLALSYAGAKIINCSWGGYGSPSQIQQDCIDEIYDNGTIIVASSNNASWDVTFGNLFSYPASYEHVISVGSVGQRNETATDSIFLFQGENTAYNVKNHVGALLKFDQDPYTNSNPSYHIDLHQTNTLNTSVDLMAPGAAVFRYGWFLFNNTYDLYNWFHTSPAAPHVSGTLGLMYSLNGCLTFEEAETILKLSSVNIDNIQANQFAFGKYGSGSLNAGRAVELTNNLIDPSEVAYIENQIFSRWDFVVNAVSDSVVIKNQIFKDSSSLDLIAKNSIYVDSETLLEPNSNGYVILEIDANLNINTNCLTNLSRESQHHKDKPEEVKEQIIFPNPNDGLFYINGIKEIANVSIYDITGKLVFVSENLSSVSVEINASNIISGIYLVNVKYYDGSTVVNKIIKK